MSRHLDPAQEVNHSPPRRRTLTILALALLVTLWAFGGQPAYAQADHTIPADVLAEFERYGAVPLIVQFELPGLTLADIAAGNTANVPADAQAVAAIAEAQQMLLARLAGHAPHNVKLFPFTPGLALTLDSLEALAALYADPAVASAGLDSSFPPAMGDSVPLIRANSNHALGLTGSGWSIAILDTGVDKDHPALAGKVIAEGCFSTTSANFGVSSLCIGGNNTVVSGSGRACSSLISGCDHGTHVAGIAAGVAPDAKIIAIQVFSRFTDTENATPCQDVNRTSPCTRSFTSDQVLALNYVLGLHTTANSVQVASVNMSLGGGRVTKACDNEPGLSSMLQAINALRDQGIATVISAGNSGYTDAMGSPACISRAISVAAANKTDVIANFSNISPHTTLIAPGTPILAAVPRAYTPIYQSKGGTSMAAPMVAGALALFKEARPNATVDQIVAALTATGPTLTDQRNEDASVSKQRLDTWAALCVLTVCDADDGRTLLTSQIYTGQIDPGSDIDHFAFRASAGQRLTVAMSRQTGNMDPYLVLLDPDGARVAINDNGGGGVNALIREVYLYKTGLYRIRASSVNQATGTYNIVAVNSTQVSNPVPHIVYTSPNAATGTANGADFWVAINGARFLPESEVHWNGQPRAKYYAGPGKIYIRVLGSDLAWPYPRTAAITVFNPGPGGGTSNTSLFTIRNPFLGESALLTPETDSSVNVGVKQSFVISWTAPAEVETWRDMQYMDMRLRDDQGEVAAWVRIVKQDGSDSFFRLLNAAEETVDEGMWGEDRDLVITDTVTLHLAESSFNGSGLTAVMTPTLTFGPAAVGTYNVEFRVDSVRGNDLVEDEEGDPEPGDDEEGEQEGNVQDDDVLGTFTILPAGCDVALAGVAIDGNGAGLINTPTLFNATVSPIDATAPVTYTWTPDPANGQGLADAVYTFDQAGEYVVAVVAENCGSFAAAVHTIRIDSGPDPDLTIGKAGPLSAVAGAPITYTLTVTNHGATAAANLVVTDSLPAGATHLTGGTLENGDVYFDLAELPGVGATETFTYVVSATQTITNHAYAVHADGAFSATGAVAVVTTIVDTQTQLDPLEPATLVYGDPNGMGVQTAGVAALTWMSMTFPAGAVVAETTVALQVGGAPPVPLPAETVAHFRLSGQQEGIALQPGYLLGEALPIQIAYAADDEHPQHPRQLVAWDGEFWSDEGIACAQGNGAHLLDCLVATPALTTYSLVRVHADATPDARLYLPTVIR